MSVSAPVVINLQIPGTLATTSEVKMAAPFSGKIVGAWAAVTTAPAGSALTAQVLVNTSVAADLSIAAGGSSDEATVTEANTAFVKGDLLVLDITGIGSGTAGANIVASVLVEASSDATAVAIEPDNRFGQA